MIESREATGWFHRPEEEERKTRRRRERPRSYHASSRYQACIKEPSVVGSLSRRRHQEKRRRGGVGRPGRESGVARPVRVHSPNSASGCDRSYHAASIPPRDHHTHHPGFLPLSSDRAIPRTCAHLQLRRGTLCRRPYRASDRATFEFSRPRDDEPLRADNFSHPLGPRADRREEARARLPRSHS